jgi:hypothetical protein
MTSNERNVSEAPRSKLRGICAKTERNFAEACHPPSSRLRRGHLALHPHSKLWGIRAKASKVKKMRLKSKNCSSIKKKVNFLPEQPIMYIKGG